ncbi:alpha/beta fold hydrolase [Actinoplanes sp. NEAU-A11]|uniref:Alpha/beta fold hydrolase n=1 Tax=Actinoplanes aureus TaxID=2792083 RepID=A0A931C8I0_9ACTN|nr:alpha/beta fold hydrolase [Actinoplanes aureus]
MTALTYTRAGNGPPLVLLHGLGSSRAAWRPVLDRLAATHTVYAVDLPGFGDSPGLGGAPRQLAEPWPAPWTAHGPAGSARRRPGTTSPPWAGARASCPPSGPFDFSGTSGPANRPPR